MRFVAHTVEKSQTDRALVFVTFFALCDLKVFLQQKSPALLREELVLACYFPFIVRKKNQDIRQYDLIFLTSLKRKIPNQKLLCTQKYRF